MMQKIFEPEVPIWKQLYVVQSLPKTKTITGDAFQSQNLKKHFLRWIQVTSIEQCSATSEHFFKTIFCFSDNAENESTVPLNVRVGKKVHFSRFVATFDVKI